jgi:hypothetical protein
VAPFGLLRAAGLPAVRNLGYPGLQPARCWGSKPRAVRGWTAMQMVLRRSQVHKAVTGISGNWREPHESRPRFHALFDEHPA